MQGAGQNNLQWITNENNVTLTYRFEGMKRTEHRLFIVETLDERIFRTCNIKIK